jgi:hypothetical protein
MKLPGSSVSLTTFLNVFEKYFWLVLLFMILALSLAFYLGSGAVRNEEKIDIGTSTVTGTLFTNCLETNLILTTPGQIQYSFFTNSIIFYSFTEYLKKYLSRF